MSTVQIMVIQSSQFELFSTVSQLKAIVSIQYILDLNTIAIRQFNVKSKMLALIV